MVMASECPLFLDQEYAFGQTKAADQLKSYAEHPFDLTDSNALTPERLKQYVSEGEGIQLLYGLQRLDDRVLEALFALAEEAQVYEKMEAMQRGEILNFICGYQSEDRSVLHTAMRDLFDHPESALAAAEAAANAAEELKRLEAFLDDLDQEEGYADLIFIGIGGSELGPKMLYTGLHGYQRPGRRVHFLSNVDPDDAAQVMSHLDLKRTLAVVVSKSGGTLETKTNEDLVRHQFSRAGLRPEEHLIAATGKGSPMDDPSRYRASFYIWDFVGGRYCSTSVIGGIVLGFAYGIEVFKEFLRGAHAMDQVALRRDPRHNLPLLSALIGIWNRNFLHYPTLAIIPYSQMLSRFSAHIQQLDMESNGKHIDRRGAEVAYGTGPIIWGEPATNAQHSFFQLIHQGTDIIPIEFLAFQGSQYQFDLEQNGVTSQEKLIANCFAQALALATGQKNANPNKNFQGNRPSSLILAERLDPFTLGALLSLYENKVVYQGFIWNINSFDQEGVQLGKVLAHRILDRIVARKTKSEGEPYPLADALLDQMRRLQKSY